MDFTIVILVALWIVSFIVWVGCFVYALIKKESTPMLISCLIMSAFAILISVANLTR